MSDNQFKYGTEYTSVKVHQRPGGNSSICLGSQPEERRYPQPRRPLPVHQPEYPQYNQRSYYQPPRAQEETKTEVHTSVKIKNPPGGRSTFSFY